MAHVDKETQPIDIQQLDESGGAVSGEVLHGGEDDPLGGGVANLEEDEEVTEGVPQQEG